jgi:hypothetical protein
LWETVSPSGKVELEFEFLCGIGKEDEQFKKASQREEKKGDGLDVRTTPVRSSTRLNGSQGKLKAEKSGRSEHQVSKQATRSNKVTG